MKTFIVLMICIFLNSFVIAQDTLKVNINEVIISSGRAHLSTSNTARHIITMHSKAFQLIPVNTLQDALQFVNGLDQKQRGPEGIQSDLSIRGSTFEQSLIMIDGIKIMDPQTGHHNMNLPLDIVNIARIEIVKGQASKTFGPNAFGGVVNIITRKVFNGVNFELAAGEHNYFKSSLTGGLTNGYFSNSFTINKSSSDGYRKNTGYNRLIFNYNSNYKFAAGTVNVFFGFNEKKFGANSFYSSRFPDQAEHTITKILNAVSTIGNNKYYITSKLSWRRNDDEFVLNKFNPSFYKNKHSSNVYSGEITAAIDSDLGLSTVGIDYMTDNIESSNLGKHKRERKGLFAEHSVEPVESINVNFGGYVYKQGKSDWQFFPGIDIAYMPGYEWKLFVSAGKAFRIPTYTELYYNDPVTIGNNNLKYEEAFEYEFGMSFNNGIINSSLSIFSREGRNIIDWIKESDNDPWRVRNISEINTTGIELSTAIMPGLFNDFLPINSLSLGYTYLKSDKTSDVYQSRYVLDHLNHQLVVNIVHKLPFESEVSWYFRYEDRLNFEDHFITDLLIHKKTDDFTISLRTANLFDLSYHDIAGVALPGRWISASVKYTIGL
ncbi:MAG: TonB-dependent receptor [Melioribacteraceae bacterium]|nr:TonB-dependent receptor [Melioribacteraceae bacterium]